MTGLATVAPAAVLLIPLVAALILALLPGYRLTARLNAAFSTSMEIGVRVEREHAETGERSLCADARATFVNVGPDGKPSPVPPLLAQNQEDRKLAVEAEERRRMRRLER